MKTTFKTVFSELDDESMDIGIADTEIADIDVDKIKSEVSMRINNDKKKPGKRLFIILVAAVLVIGLTVGAVAAGSVQAVFGRIFQNSDGMNELGLFDGGNVEVITEDDSLNVQLLGITGDGEKLFSAIEITKKDGSPVIDSDYAYPANSEPFDGSSWEDKLTVNGADETQNALQSPQYVLSDGNKTLTIYLFTTAASGLDGSLQDGRMTFISKQFHVNKVTNELASVKLPGLMDPIFDEMKNNDELSADDVLFDKEELAKKRSELGLSEDDFTTIDYKGTRIYCQAEQKAFELPFTISYDLNYRIDKFIEKDLSAETAPEVVVKNTRNAKMTVSPFSIYLSGECDADNPDSPIEYGQDKCFLLPEWDDSGKVTLTDGTVYYLFANEGGEHRTDENGVYHTTVHLKYSTVIGPPLQPEDIFVNIKDIESVVINGDMIYQK